MSAKAIFGGLIAIVLLGIYVYLVVIAFGVLGCSPAPDCSSTFTEDMASSLPLLAGLVAAPIIAELAVTKSGEVPFQRVLGTKTGETPKTILRVLVFVYFAIWLGSGLLALFAGWRHPGEVEALSALGKTWLGLAVSAGYAYFGITPPGG